MKENKAHYFKFILAKLIDANLKYDLKSCSMLKYCLFNPIYFFHEKSLERIYFFEFQKKKNYSVFFFTQFKGKQIKALIINFYF